jgi:isoleucyl-tRNA synthetase
MENPYITYNNDYIESEWWALKKIWDKNLLYKGHKVVPYCPRCGTSLSSHEVAQGYKEVQEESIYVRFSVSGQPDTYFLAWTTTPWTLPSNVALCVNRDIRYVKVEAKSDIEGDADTVYYYLAADLVHDVLGEEVKIIQQYHGNELVGMEYIPLFEYGYEKIKKMGKKAFFLTEDPYVSLSEGTGIVHIAPAFGEDDARVGKKYDLPFIQFVGPDGCMTSDVTDFKGQFCKEADKDIVRKLIHEKKLIRKKIHEHSYPFCWRCDTALIYYARNSWFIEMTKIKSRMIENNRKIHWIPDTIQEGRFGNFLENLVDWGISRERYWGTPLPIWECRCGHRHLIGSIAELKELAVDCPEYIELHRPYIDQVHIRCAKCSQLMTRAEEVIDCWFDSGSMPFAQWHYPFENKDQFTKQFPAEFISEAVDQTRGWFYTLLAISTLLFDTISFKNCIVLGLVLDGEGLKMSKHKGNVVDPWSVLNHQGADAIRWYFYTASAPWLPSRFSPENVIEAQRKFMGTLWNTYAFFVMYAGIDQYIFNPDDHQFSAKELPVIDRWILSRLNSLVQKVDAGLARYDITGSARAISEFTDELSNWYVRRNRDRFWAEGMENSKQKAFSTLYQVLVTIAKLSAPFIPFMSESIYQNLVCENNPTAPESIHLCDYPVCKVEYIDANLEESMADVLEIVALGRAARSNCGIKNRQPLRTIKIMAPRVLELESNLLIMEELNVKNVEYIKDSSGLFDYRFKPQLKTLGKKYGKMIPAITEILSKCDGIKTMEKLRENGRLNFVLDEKSVELTEEDLLIETIQAQGVSVESDRGFTVALDTNLSQELISEGFVREMISKIQTMRKEAGFEVLDRIVIGYESSEIIRSVIESNKKHLCDEVLAVKITEELKGYRKEWNVNGEKVTFSVLKTR